LRLLRVALCLATIAVFLPPSASADHGDIRLAATRARYLESQDVKVTLFNDSATRIELLGGTIRRAHDGGIVARLIPQRRFLPSHAQHDWTWEHSSNAGAFVASMRTSEGRFSDTFQIGAFFTLDFHCEDTGDCKPIDPYVIYVREERPLRRLRADLERPAEERRIVSGVVRRGKGYNPEWSYVMDPGTIVLGDVFVEVCDAHPQFVEDNREDWLGERWCPWSSYASSEGR
jgi:hypothetical protein